MADANLDIRVTSKGIKEAHEALRKLGVSADKAEEAVKQYKEETKKNTTAQKQYAAQQQKTTATVSQAAKVHKEARGGFRAMRGATQQLSFQLQDVAVQAQSGTAGLTILAQQGPQILSIFGPGGAIAGAFIAFGALIAGVLLPSLMDSEEKVDDLGEALDRLKGITDRTKGGVLALSEEFAKLTKESQALAELEIELDISKTKRGLERSIKDIEEALNFDIIGSLNSFQRYEETIKNLRDGFGRGATVSLAFIGRIREAGQAVGLSGQQFNKLALALAGFEKGRTPELFANLQKTVKDLRSESSDTEAYDKFAEVFVQQARNVRLATGALQDLETVQEKIASGQLGTVAAIEAADREAALRDQATASVEEMIRKQQVMYADSHTQFIARQEEQYSTQAALIKKAGADVEALERLRAEIDQNILAHAVQTEQKITAATEAENRKRINIALQSAKQAQSQVSQAQSFVDSIMTAGMNQTEKQLHNLDRQLRSINALKDAEVTYTNALGEEVTQRLITQEQYAAAVQSIAHQTAQIQTEANKSYLDQWVEGTREAVERIDLLQTSMAMSLESNMANAFEGILTGTMTAKEAFLEFTRGMLKAFLGAIAQMIAKRLALAAVEKLMGKAVAVSAATYMGLTAQAQSIMAGINAFTSTAAIPVVGPAAAPAAMATAIGVTAPMAAAVTALSSAAAAARATGGQVRGGQSYLVGERGPELLTMGGSGRISSNDQLKQAVGGGGGITIVNNVDARGADASVDVKIRKAMQETAATTIETIRDLSRRRRFI